MAVFKNALYLLRNLPSAKVFYQSLTEAEKLVEKNLYIDLYKPSETEKLTTSCSDTTTTTTAFHELVGLVYNRPREVISLLLSRISELKISVDYGMELQQKYIFRIMN